MIVKQQGVRSSGLGRALDPASDAQDVAQGADVDLPLWMIQNLAARQMVTLRWCPAPALRRLPLHRMARNHASTYACTDK